MQIGTSATSNELHQMHEQLEQQTMQTRQALAQLMLVREQLITETNARIEAQVYYIFHYFFFKLSVSF